MTSQQASRPVGIFDSGVGGLTVAHAVKKILPGEQLIYFGDLAHLPYGDKSTAAIQAYSIKICDVLLERKCKVILIACNSASAAAYDLIKEYVGSKAQVMNVIDPVIHYLRENLSNRKVGLIGTKQTVGSAVYEKKVNDLNQGIQLASLATPLLVPLIEEGFINNQVSEQVLNQYLSIQDFDQIEALILGCTHYPLIKDQVNNYFEDKVEILDSAEIVAAGLKAMLEYYHLVNQSAHSDDHFMVSDYTPFFEEAAQRFFHESVKLEKYPLWE